MTEKIKRKRSTENNKYTEESKKNNNNISFKNFKKPFYTKNNIIFDADNNVVLDQKRKAKKNDQLQ